MPVAKAIKIGGVVPLDYKSMEDFRCPLCWAGYSVAHHRPLADRKAARKQVEFMKEHFVEDHLNCNPRHLDEYDLAG